MARQRRAEADGELRTPGGRATMELAGRETAIVEAAIDSSTQGIINLKSSASSTL